MSTSAQMFNFNTPASGSGQEFNFLDYTGGGSTPGMGGNQWMNFPSLPNQNVQNSGAVPAANANNAPSMPSAGGQPGLAPTAPSYGGPTGGPGYGTPGVRNTSPTAGSANSQYYAGSPLDPALTSQMFGYLQSQIGKGVSAYPGTLTAPNNAVTQQLTQSFQPGGNMNQMAQTGDPIDQLPQWKAAVQASQQNIQQNEAQLREQMSVGGNLAGTPFGQSMANYLSQTTSTENAQLLQQQAQALESAQGRKLTANEFMGQFGEYLQGLDQQSIDRMYQEYVRTSPQNNPLINAQYGAATTFPQYLKKNTGGGGVSALVGALGGGVGNLDTTGSSSAGEQVVNFLGGL